MTLKRKRAEHCIAKIIMQNNLQKHDSLCVHRIRLLLIVFPPHNTNRKLNLHVMCVRVNEGGEKWGLRDKTASEQCFKTERMENVVGSASAAAAI